MFYQFAKTLLGIIFGILYRVKVTGKEFIPAKGGFVLCSNHVNALDPIFIGTSIRRGMYYMGKKEIFSNWFYRRLFRHLNVFPVDRQNVGLDTLKTAVKLLKEGKSLMIFSQGTRMKEIDAADAKAGAALFAVKAGVPVVPVGIRSSFKFFNPVYIRFGQAITLEEYEGKKIKSADLNEITERIMERVKALAEGTD